MRLIVAGGRRYKNKEEVYRILDKLYKTTPNLSIVSGLADGPDSFGKEWAEDNGVDCHEFPANWTKYGKRAGFIRNEEMARFGTALLVFWDGVSKGSRNMISLGYKYDLKVAIVRYDDPLAKPRKKKPKGAINKSEEPQKDILDRWFAAH